MSTCTDVDAAQLRARREEFVCTKIVYFPLLEIILITRCDENNIIIYLAVVIYLHYTDMTDNIKKNISFEISTV